MTGINGQTTSVLIQLHFQQGTLRLQMRFSRVSGLLDYWDFSFSVPDLPYSGIRRPRTSLMVELLAVCLIGMCVRS